MKRRPNRIQIPRSGEAETWPAGETGQQDSDPATDLPTYTTTAAEDGDPGDLLPEFLPGDGSMMGRPGQEYHADTNSLGSAHTSNHKIMMRITKRASQNNTSRSIDRSRTKTWRHELTETKSAHLAGVLTVAYMIPLICGQRAMASSWAVEKFENYRSHPDWIETRCQNMQKVNAKGLSNFTEKVALLEKEYNPNFSSQSAKEIIQFYRLFGQKFCSTAW